jgi:hypothetical protein
VSVIRRLGACRVTEHLLWNVIGKHTWRKRSTQSVLSFEPATAHELRGSQGNVQGALATKVKAPRKESQASTNGMTVLYRAHLYVCPNLSSFMHACIHPCTSSLAGGLLHGGNEVSFPLGTQQHQKQGGCAVDRRSGSEHLLLPLPVALSDWLRCCVEDE